MMDVTMNCENYLCIYQKRGVCILNSITPDVQGHCEECIYISPKPKELENQKQKILERYAITGD